MYSIPEEILHLLQIGGKKNIRIHFPNGERGDINADSLVSESFSFNDSICSRSELTFGLCEMPYLEFETFGVENVKGATVDAMLEVCCPDTVAGSVYESDINENVYKIPFGRFVVSECEKQADMTHRRFVCHSIVSNKSWMLPEYIAKSLSVPMWEKNALIDTGVKFEPKISIEAVIAMLFPDTGRNYTRYQGGGGGLRYTDSYTAPDGTQYEMDFYTSNYPNVFAGVTDAPAVSVCKEHYTEEYLQTVAGIRAKKLEIGWDDDINFGWNNFATTLFGETVSTTSWRAFGDYSGGWQNTFTADGLSKAFYPQSEAFVVPYIIVKSNQEIYPRWVAANGGALEGVGTMSTIFFSITPPMGWDRVTGIVLRDVTHGETLFSARLNAADDYIDFECDAVPLELGSSGINIDIGYTYKKKQLMSKSGTTTRRMAWLSAPVLYTEDWYKWVPAFIQLEGKFGHVDRNGNLEIFSLKDKFAGLYPSETLYPADDLYPSENVGAEIGGADYRSMWYGDEQTLFYGKVITEFTDADDNDKSTVTAWCDGFTEESDPSTFLTVDLSSNEIIKSKLWTEDAAQAIVDAVAQNISGVRFMPARLTMQGRPDLDAGDIVEITTEEGVIPTIMLSRSLDGIQTLVDNIQSN